MNKKLISLGLILLLTVVFSACLQEKTSQGYNAENDYKVKIIDDGKAVEIVRYKGKKKRSVSMFFCYFLH